MGQQRISIHHTLDPFIRFILLINKRPFLVGKEIFASKFHFVFSRVLKTKHFWSEVQNISLQETCSNQRSLSIFAKRFNSVTQLQIQVFSLKWDLTSIEDFTIRITDVTLLIQELFYLCTDLDGWWLAGSHRSSVGRRWMVSIWSSSSHLFLARNQKHWNPSFQKHQESSSLSQF